MCLKSSFSDSSFSTVVEIFIYFIYAAGVRFPSECVARVDKQRLLLWDVAAFLLSHQIPAVVRIFLNECRIIKMGSILMLLVLVVAEGLSGPHGSPDGWPNPDCGAAWARLECPVPGHPADGAGAGGGEGTAQSHTGCYCCDSRPTGCFNIYRISFGLFLTEDFSQ